MTIPVHVIRTAAVLGTTGVALLGAEDWLRFFVGGLLPGAARVCIAAASAVALTCVATSSRADAPLRLIALTLLIQLAGRPAVESDAGALYVAVEVAHAAAPVVATLVGVSFLRSRHGRRENLVSIVVVCAALSWFTASWTPLPLPVLVGAKALTLTAFWALVALPALRLITPVVRRVLDSGAVR
ncbi:hypothetical protein [Curtobacterium sp. VKM Ac-1376]|uniref:hypothetical protein n=1 Tax=Curtobacterium sp. VKM Ac-1376 TaxID=123312 RepID=UPI00188B6B63|nr:hypothetical protein [Curtobacterium sp. VKM Ac-1376]MBF4613400.1 hypothetical protein [Curtobacterium sp. VKM Ac-1376]